MDNAMTITNAQYHQIGGENDSIKAIINGKEMTVPLDLDNIHYAEMMRQFEAGTLTIADAD